MIVIDKGEIAEQGTHDELLHHNGVYKKLVLRQLTAGAVTEMLVNNDDNNADDDIDLLDLNHDTQDSKNENHDLLD